jgi:hypothetical protein
LKRGIRWQTNSGLNHDKSLAEEESMDEHVVERRQLGVGFCARTGDGGRKAPGSIVHGGEHQADAAHVGYVVTSADIAQDGLPQEALEVSLDRHVF